MKTRAAAILARARLSFLNRAEQIMAMPARPLHARHRRWTLQEVYDLPDMPGKLRELIDGALIVSPSPGARHQWVVYALLRIMGDFVETHHVAGVLGGPADVPVNGDTLVQPDVLVVPLTNGHKPLEWSEMGTPLLVIEVLSPNSIRHDRIVKRRLYAALGIEYWIVDMDARAVERYMPRATQPEIRTDAIVWSPVGFDQSLTVDIPGLFERAWS